jgi:ERCC4-type nuclease
MASILVHVDYREAELISYLKNEPVLAMDTPNLDVGDVMFVNAETEQPYLVLERKTLADLASSNRDGRYREQRARLLSLKGQGVTVGYLLEVGAGWSSGLNNVWNGGVTEKLLATIVARLQTRHGMPVFQVRDSAGSASYIRLLAKMLTEDPTCLSPLNVDATVAAGVYTEALSVQKSANRNLKRTAAGMLCAIPGVGAKMSEGLLDACGGTLEGLMAKSKEELAVLKVGKKSVGVVSEAIWTALHCK